MATGYTTFARLAKMADADTDWGGEYRPTMDALDWILAVGGVVHLVHPSLTAGNVYPQGTPAAGSKRFHSTIQDAINENEAAGGNHLILVAPTTAHYSEKLTITKNVSIRGLPGLGQFYGGGEVKIRGDGTASEVVRIQPQDATVLYVSLSDLQFDNKYATTNGTEITAAPYWLRMPDIAPTETWPTNINILSIERCTVRGQTWGLDNKWEALARVFGFWQIRCRSCHFAGLGYGGGNDNGFVRRLWDIEGDSTTKRMFVHLADCDLSSQAGASAGSPTLRGAYLRSYAQFMLTRSHATFAGGSFCEVHSGATATVQIGFPGGGAGADDAWAQNGFAGSATTHV